MRLGMIGIQRFITYIYTYENDEKRNNAGYAKVETKGKDGRIEIHFISSGVFGTGRVTFLLVQEQAIIELPIGEIQIENGRGIGKFLFQTEALDNTQIPFDKIDGIGVTDANGQKHMSFWKDVKIEKMQFVLYGEEIPQQQEIKEDRIEISESEQKPIYTMEIPVQNIFPSDTMEDIWHAMKKGRECIKIGKNVQALQMELNDLREFPKKYWGLGNNSFLLHGFFNYRHLLFGKLTDGNWFLGVPGVYERQERVMASIFGFAGFLPLIEVERENIPLEEQFLESYTSGQQGIWYQVLN